MPRRPLARSGLSAAVVGILSCGNSVGAFVTNTRNSARCRQLPDQNPIFVDTRGMSFLEMRASRGGESGGSSPVRKQYSAEELERLREAARCPEAFERLSLNMKSESGDGCANGGEEPEETPPPKNKKKGGGYQRIEDWDADQKSRKDGSGMTWEEKCMFDGQRHGNQVRQNDILIRNLHTW